MSTGAGYRERNSTAERALEILTLFDETRLIVSANHVASVLGVARSTSYRYLQSLAASGFLEEVPGRGFRLGIRVLELANLARRGFGLPEVTLPLIAGLSSRVEETVLLTRRLGPTVVCLERHEANHTVRISYERGSILPLNAGASAQVLLAWLPDDEARQLLDSQQLQRFTPRTLTNVDDLLERFAQIRADGYAISRGELDNDVLGVAAVVRIGNQPVNTAISVAAMGSRISNDRLPLVIADVIDTAAELSRQLTLTAS